VPLEKETGDGAAMGGVKLRAMDKPIWAPFMFDNTIAVWSCSASAGITLLRCCQMSVVCSFQEVGLFTSNVFRLR